MEATQLSNLQSSGKEVERSRRENRIWIDLVFLAIVMLFHVVLAIYYKNYRGLDILANPGLRDWDWWWQTIPRELLRTDLWRSIYYLHSQPPLFNLFGALLFNLFDESAMEGMQYTNILLGASIIGMCYVIMRLVVNNQFMAFAASLFFAFSPGLYLFEAYILYDIQTTFLVILTVFFLSLCAWSHRLLIAALFILSVNMLILTRATYHILLLPIAFLFVIIILRHRWKPLIMIIGILSIFSFFWYTKNLYIFDIWGVSSWQGLSLWKVASTKYSQEELIEISTQGDLDPMLVEQRVFAVPSNFKKYGFNKISDIPVLSEDDLNNINVIEISKSYQHGAIELIKLDFNRYLKTIADAYKIYSLPLSQFKHHPVNSEKIIFHVSTYARYVDGQIVGRYFGRDYFTVHFLLVPISLVIYLLILIRKYRQYKNLVIAFEKAIPESWMAFLILYTTVVSVLLEIGENNRYRFYVENLVWMLCFIGIYKMIPSKEKIIRIFKFTGRTNSQVN